ncbi:RNA polymerase I-specific transcription initiation factor rrn11 [Phanerochaete sordida]|uniref:RNA polymerase I-specific transcription initiation factor rrn11 n=1 Tax=Phanerochaete sordida TaxID=48140 RepID=A0A9P3L7R4_9APHY|nr:RNA polymerase I-specific transcription initiation factor rrn11 [Phanerochaete sordida]
MSSDPYKFLFSYPDAKQTLSARKVHIRRLYDILELSIHRSDFVRAKKAWSILVRCKEVNWRVMWRTGALLVGKHDDPVAAARERLEYLTTMMLQHPEARESVIQEMILQLVASRQYRRALDELELYLPSPPFQENSVLHAYAGLICLYLAQPNRAADVSSEGRSLRDAQQYLDRARYLDPNNLVAAAWSDAIPQLSTSADDRITPVSDDEDMTLDGAGQRVKRART